MAVIKQATTVVVNNPADREGNLKQIGGSQSDDWNSVLANHRTSGAVAWLTKLAATLAPKRRTRATMH